MQNKIHYVSSEMIPAILDETKLLTNLHIVELNGEEIQSWEDYIRKIEDTFKLPTEWNNTIDSYDDWMRDLSWLGKDSYMLIIYSSEKFFANDPSFKKIILECFEDSILPWWEKDVELYEVDGKSKLFNVYLVN